MSTHQISRLLFGMFRHENQFAPNDNRCCYILFAYFRHTANDSPIGFEDTAAIVRVKQVLFQRFECTAPESPASPVRIKQVLFQNLVLVRLA